MVGSQWQLCQNWPPLKKISLLFIPLSLHTEITFIPLVLSFKSLSYITNITKSVIFAPSLSKKSSKIVFLIIITAAQNKRTNRIWYLVFLQITWFIWGNYLLSFLCWFVFYSWNVLLRVIFTDTFHEYLVCIY